MELPGLPPLKRPIELPTPETLAAIFNNSKRQKLSSITGILQDTNSNQRLVSNIGQLPESINLPIPFTHQQFEAPLLNSVPSNIIPIIHPPATINNYFTDVKTDLTNKSLSNQIIGIIQKFPPPLPPFAPSERSPQLNDNNGINDDERGGIMVPFIYPPPPIINPDTLPYSITSLKQKLQALNSDNELSTNKADKPMPRGRKPTKKVQEQHDRRKEQEPEKELQGIYIQAPPLPFPPPNYMSYPLSANKSTLVPEDVFQAFITASEELPRTDMVVASAAGSLFDMRDQAIDEGFNIEDYERNRPFLSDNEDDDEENEGWESDDDGAAEYDINEKLYFRQIDTTDYVDPFERDNRRNLFEVNLPLAPQFTTVSQRLSKLKDANYSEEKSFPDVENIFEFAQGGTRRFLEDVAAADIIDNPSKDITLPSGSNRERRRRELVRSMYSVEDFSQDNRDEIYRIKKNKLLTRLNNLRNSKITFTNIDTKDEELDKFSQVTEIERDEQLVQLKLSANYELLKTSLVFYEDSNKIYKNLNLVLINKLEKLKNFFEYQRDLFTEYLERKQDIFDIKSKESQKLFNGISNRNYSQEIKNIIKSSIINEQDQQYLKPVELSEHDLTTLPEDTSNVLVHDFMPLVTPEEFCIITGDIPRKSKLSNNSKDNKPPTNMKHHIFQNSLYERMTSGSDTNASEAGNISSGAISGSGSATTGPKRRGRRSAAQNLQQTGSGSGNIPGGNTNGGSSNNIRSIENNRDGLGVKYSETALMAKIMKQFSGPQSAMPDELTHDLAMMGIHTRWPVSK
ncbi:hypothetical protein JA1_000070 [Spathaspora sp. JA1]|nr:hypothetical protein JA1_000070 [Spathaspora sp. JA1]